MHQSSRGWSDGHRRKETKQKEKVSRAISALLGVFFAINIITLGFFLYAFVVFETPSSEVVVTTYVSIDPEYEVEQYNPPQAEPAAYVSRIAVNNHIEGHTKSEIIQFYSSYTRSDIISDAIISRALQANVPVNLAFAVAYVESRYNPNAYNRNGSSSTDRGLFQLNDSYRGHWTIEEFYDIHMNTEEGIGYLSYCLDVADGDVRMAIAAYNAGPDVIYSGDIPSRTIRHIDEILQYEDMLTMEFNKHFLDWSQS